MNFLKRHPFAVVAHFEKVLAVSFAFPEAVLRPLISPGLELDSYNGHGFVTVAFVWTREMRPAGFPAALGQDFFLAGYRVFTRLRDDSGRRLRGLKILRSETDKQSMVRTGNLFTRYNYRHVTLRKTEDGPVTKLETFLRDGSRTLSLSYKAKKEDAPLPAGSPFPDWRTARQFAGPMPFTFSDEGDGRFVVIEGVRSNWTPRPVVINDWDVALFKESPFCQAKPILANAFAVEDIPYRWEKGRIVTPGGNV